MVEEDDGFFFPALADDFEEEVKPARPVSSSAPPSSSSSRAVPAHVSTAPRFVKGSPEYFADRAARRAHKITADGQPRVKARSRRGDNRKPRVKKGRRGGVFMQWLLDTFGLLQQFKQAQQQQQQSQQLDDAATPSSLSSTSAPASSPSFHLVDVAGGRGQIAFYLAAFHRLPVAVIDPASMAGVQRYSQRYHQERVAKRRARAEFEHNKKNDGSLQTQQTPQEQEQAVDDTPAELLAAFEAASLLSASSAAGAGAGAGTASASAAAWDGGLFDASTGVRVPVAWLPELTHLQCMFPDSIALSLHKQYARPAPSPSSTTADNDASSDEELRDEDAMVAADATAADDCCQSASPSPDTSSVPSATVQSVLSSCSLLYGMHADGATEALVDYALLHGKPFAVVPCCVFPDSAAHRRVRRRDAQTGQPTQDLIPVRSYEQFLDYLQDKHPDIQRTNLDFEGRNTCIYRTMLSSSSSSSLTASTCDEDAK